MFQNTHQFFIDFMTASEVSRTLVILL